MREYRSAQASYGTANFTHLAVLKHQNTKTSLYKLSKNHWVNALFETFGSFKNYSLRLITLYYQSFATKDNKWD